MDTSEPTTWLHQSIDLLQNYTLERDTRGHSRIPCFVLTKKTAASGPNRFFMKLYPSDRVADLQHIGEMYYRAKVPTAQVIQSGYLADHDTTYCIYEFIEGATLRELLKKLSAGELETIGYQTGAELGKFRGVTSPDRVFSSNLHQELEALLQNAHAEKRRYNQTHSHKLPRVNLQRLERSLWHLKSIIDQVELNFTHGDINLYNIILCDGRPVFIDTDGGKIASRALDFRGNCWWGWTGNNTEREQAVYRGIYRGYFDDQIPASFHQELGFAIIYEFLLRLKRYEAIDEQTYYSFLRWHDILERTKYFESYKFSWF